MRALLVPSVAFLLVAAVMVEQARTPDPALAEAPTARLVELPGYTSAPLEVSEAELTVLPKDTQFDKRTYVDEMGRWFAVSLVVGGRSKSSIHRPELCLPAQGFQMTAPRTADAGGVSWHLVTLARRDAPPLGFAYTFFNQAGFRTSSHVARILCDVWDRSFRSRIDRWAMLTVNASTADDAVVTAFLAKLRKGVIP